MTQKTSTSWIPQPMGFGYVTSKTSVPLETKLLKNLETKTLLPLETAGRKVTGKNPTVWGATGL